MNLPVPAYIGGEFPVLDPLRGMGKKSRSQCNRRSTPKVKGRPPARGPEWSRDRTERFERNDAWALTLTLIKSGIFVTETLGNLIDMLPEDAYPGEDPGEVVTEMAAGSIVPLVNKVGRKQCRETIELIDSVVESILGELRLAAEIAGRREKGYTV